jgi:KTSC domain
MPAPLAIARLLGAGALSATDVSAARIAKGIGLLRLLDTGEADEHEDMIVPVASTAISAIGWRKDGIISVTFHRGGTYTYDGDYELFQAFLAAPSKGQFFNSYFK